MVTLLPSAVMGEETLTKIKNDIHMYDINNFDDDDRFYPVRFINDLQNMERCEA